MAKQKRAVQADPTSAIVGSLKQKPQDPFQCLSSVEVGIIIESLPVESTHILRLVSKLWKASSEYHNAALAIQRHFPNSALGMKTYATREEANLQFQRLLYHQQSVKKGLATRATRCRSADFWHLNGNTLLWASKSGSISVRNLRSVGNAPSTQGKALNLKVFAHLFHRAELCEASLIDNGDILVHAYTWSSSKRLSKGHDSYDAIKVMRMSQEGRVLWEILHKTTDILWPLAVGTRYFYYVHESRSLDKLYFYGRSLEDGTLIFQKKIPLGPGYPAYHLELFGNEKWFALASGGGWVSLFDATSGEMATFFRCDGWPVLSRTEGKYWEVKYSSAGSLKPCSKGTYDAKEKRWTHEDLSLQFHIPETLGFSNIAFDSELQLCFRIKSDDSSHILRLSVAPLTAQEPLQEDGTRVPGLTQSSSFTTVTLPTELPRQSLTRRNLKFQLPREKFARHPGFRVMIGDYIVIPDPVVRTILVLDFWPDW